MHRFMVNIKSEVIFNGIQESYNSAQNTENFAQIRMFYACSARVYHVLINHAAPTALLHLALTRNSCGLVPHRDGCTCLEPAENISPPDTNTPPRSSFRGASTPPEFILLLFFTAWISTAV
jgi:hypothetical protein